MYCHICLDGKSLLGKMRKEIEFESLFTLAVDTLFRMLGMNNHWGDMEHYCMKTLVLLDCKEPSIM